MYVYLIFTWTVEVLCKTKPRVLISLLDTGRATAFLTLPAAYRWKWKNWKKELWLFPSSFRPCIVFSVSAWLIHESRISKKKYNRVLGGWCYSQGHCLLSTFEVDSCGRCGFPTDSVANTHSDLFLASSPAGLPCILGSLEFCAVSPMPRVNGEARNGRRAYHAHLLCSCPCCAVLPKHKFKGKGIKIQGRPGRALSPAQSPS